MAPSPTGFSEESPRHPSDHRLCGEFLPGFLLHVVFFVVVVDEADDVDAVCDCCFGGGS